MPINLDEAIGAELEPVEFSWNSNDIQLYHLGLGAGADPMDKQELRYLTDDTPQVLPTFGNVAQSFHMTEPPAVKFPGIDIELSKVLHASEAVEVPGPIPPAGTGVAVTRFTEIWDKAKAAVIWSETTVNDPTGTLLWKQKRSIFARGEGGFGGDRGPSTSQAAPDRAEDRAVRRDLPTHRREEPVPDLHACGREGHGLVRRPRHPRGLVHEVPRRADPGLEGRGRLLRRPRHPRVRLSGLRQLTQRTHRRAAIALWRWQRAHW